MSRRLPVFSSSFALALALSGCGNAPLETAPAAEIGVSEQPIKGGYFDDFDTAVVGIYEQQSTALCSGSLIAPNVVLTARHCVSDVYDGDQGVDCNVTSFGPAWAPDGFLVTTGPEVVQGAYFHGVREVIILNDTSVCGADQAILILSDVVGGGEATPLVPRLDEPLAPGEEYFAVGFGATDDDGSGSGTRRRRDTLFVDCVGDACGQPNVRATEWRGDQGICSGDSGGPAIDMSGRVVGVTSRGGAGCMSPVYGYTMGFAQWIRDAALYGASVGGYAAPAWATGSPSSPSSPGTPAAPGAASMGQGCAVGSDCASGLCIDDGGLVYCTQSCDAGCPEGYACDGSLGVCAWNDSAGDDDDDDDDDELRYADDGCAASPGPVGSSSGALLLGLLLRSQPRGGAAIASRRLLRLPSEPPARSAITDV